jgi:transcriptional regulator with XRE-family HTH domain
MLTTGNQLRAARALVGMGQSELAEKTKLSVTTISNMEGQGASPFRSSFETVRTVQKVLEAAGVEFLNGNSPGVRLRPKA